MKIAKHFPYALLFAGFMAVSPLFAAQADSLVHPLQQQWAVIKYQTPKEQRPAALEKLAEEAHQLSTANSDAAEPLIWEAIILSTLAGEKGGLGALSLAKQARDLLLQAEKINPHALDGSVYTSLGSLYYQVPGWPIGFGNDKKAREYLEKALQINPNGIDPQYFYGDYLLQEGDYQGAIDHLEKALTAPPRPGRELADQGRMEEIRADLAKAKEKL